MGSRGESVRCAVAKQYILFDEADNPVGITFSNRSNGPAIRTLEKYGAVGSLPVNICTREQIEQAQRKVQPDPRAFTGPARRRTGGHGYSGGDGFTEI